MFWRPLRWPILFVLAPLLQAQGPQTLTANARLVVLDAAVTDAAGKPVEGLTAEDFEVYEDGKLQHLRSVEPPSLHTLPAESAAAGAVFDPARPASFGQSAVDILVLDQLNTHFNDSAFARRSVHDFLARQPALLAQPTTLLSVYDGHFRQLAGFTRDREALLRALAAAPPQYAWTLEVNGKADHGPLERLDQSLRALEEMAQSYARIPGRKNLIWVGTGFPSQDPAALAAKDLHEVQEAIRHVTNVSLDTRVTVYAVDPTSTLPGMTEITDATQMAFAESADSVAGSIDPFGANEDFDRLGPVTGGRVIRGRNDVAGQIESAVRLGAEFYTLAYTPANASESAAKYRKIRVVCVRPGLTVAARDGYYTGAPQPKDALAEATYDLTTAAESPMPLNGLHVVVSAGTLAGTYKVQVDAANLTWKPKADGSASASVYVMAVALNAKNKMLAHAVLGMTANAGAGANLGDVNRTADFVMPASAAPKTATLRFIVRDSGTGRMGSFDLPVAQR